ncbi:MAG: NAD(P)H-dependent oxidoreductase [Roseburia sp.]|nr:NAD(P)H-dependent oxidoreductase [Roseburia sp.]
MKILVLNGSPKGAYSITLQTVNYLEKLHAEHTFEVLHVGQRIKALEKDFSPALTALESADLLLFSYPVYTFVAPCQLHRFIELMKDSGISFDGKYATQISTSKHFYDVTAHRYIQDNCHDMGLKYIRGLSADMDDLLNEKGQKEARDFFDFVCWSASQDIYETAPAAQPAPVHAPVHVPEDSDATKTGDIVIVTDCSPEDTQLADMIARFRAIFPRKTRIFNIREYNLMGGCLSCFGCAITGKCVYKDNFDEVLRGEIQTAQSIVYAFSIKDHSMGSLFKMYNDRNFCNGHRTVTIGMPVGYLVSGNYRLETNLQTIMEARAQVGCNFLAGVATDEQDTDVSIDKMAATLTYALEHSYVPPQNFYGIGGMKIFRDLIWLMQGMMKADHKFYKSHNQYDFPQKNWPTMLKMYLVGALIANPKVKAKMGNAMNEGMIAPYKKILDNLN